MVDAITRPTGGHGGSSRMTPGDGSPSTLCDSNCSLTDRLTTPARARRRPRSADAALRVSKSDSAELERRGDDAPPERRDRRRDPKLDAGRGVALEQVAQLHARDRLDRPAAHPVA